MERGELSYPPSDRAGPSERVVRVVLVAAVLSSVVHYTDNLVNIEDYPQPHWINSAVIPIAWLILTAVGVAGYVFFRRGRFLAAGLALAVYSYTGLSSLAHYRFGPASAFTPKMHAGIWLDGVTGATVLVVSLWLLFGARRRDGSRSP